MGEAGPCVRRDGAGEAANESPEVAAPRASASAAEAPWRRAAAACGDGVWEWLAETGEVTWSDRCFTMLGYQPGAFALHGERWRELIHPDERERVLRELAEQLVPGSPGFMFEARLRRADGQWHRVVVRGQIMATDSAGKPLRMVGTQTDVHRARLAEDALQERNTILLESQRVARLGHYIHDARTGTWTSSPVLDEVFGIGPDYLRDTEGWLALVHPDDRVGMAEYLANHVVRDGNAFDREYRIIRASDGAERWVHGRGHLLFGSDGSTEWMLGVVQDIDDPKRAEEALARTRARLALAQQAGRVGTHEWDVPGGRILVAEGMDELYGGPGQYPHDYQAWTRRIHPDDRGRARQQLADALAGYADYDTEYRILWPDGSVHWIASRGYVERDAEGRASRLLGVNIDITAAKQAEAALRESEERFRRAVVDAPIPIAIHAEDGEFLLVNQAWLDLSGYTRAEIPTIGAWTELVYGERHAPIRERIDQLYALDQRVDEGDFTITTKLGDERVWEFSTAPLGRLGDGRRMAISMAMDVTARRQAEETLREQLELQDQFVKTALTVPGVICSFAQTPDGRVTIPFAMPEIEDLYGVAREALADDAQAMLANVHPEDLARLTNGIARSAHRLTFWQDTWRYHHPSKGWRWIQGRSLPRRRPDGSVLWHGFVQDVTEQHEADEALRVQAHVLENIGQGVNYIDEHGVIGYANPAFEAMFGYAPGELVGQHCSVLNDLSPEENEALAARMWQALQDQGWYAGEYRSRRKDGSSFITWAKTTPLPLPGATVWVTVQEDITERKRSEAELWASQARLASLLEAAPIGIGITVNRVITHANAQLLRLLGYEAAELIGRNSRFLYPDDDEYERLGRPGFDQELTFVGTMETRWVRKDGTVIDVLVSSVDLDRGRPETGTTFTALDITERKAAEAALRESQAGLQRAHAVAQLGGWQADTPRGLIRLSEETLRLFGLPAPAGDGTVTVEHASLHELAHPDDRDALRQAWVTGQTTRSFDLEHRIIVDGAVRWVRNRAEPEHDEAGALVGWFGTVQDITERKAAEAEHEALQAQLRQAQKMEAVGRLAGGVAHDFNNMLGVIVGYTELALASLGSAHPLHEDLLEILGAARRSSDLTRQLLAFSRQQVIAPVVLDLNAQVEGMARLLQRIIGEDIVLRFALGGDVGPVYMDPSQIDQVVANLSVNARDAMPAGGELTIATSSHRQEEGAGEGGPSLPPGDYVVLSVSDTGCGMDAATKALVFEPFFTTKPEGRGTGLGLATVYGIAQQNGGDITIESEPGRGTRFRLYLPRCAGEAAAPASPAAGAQPGLGGRVVLLVEDQDQVRRLVARMLKRLGLQVVVAKDAADALGLARTADRIDLLLTDLVMPEMNGEELAARIQALRPGLRTLFMSGYPAHTIAERGVLAEGARYLQKPFTTESLAEKLREVLWPGMLPE